MLLIVDEDFLILSTAILDINSKIMKVQNICHMIFYAYTLFLVYLDVPCFSSVLILKNKIKSHDRRMHMLVCLVTAKRKKFMQFL